MSKFYIKQKEHYMLQMYYKRYARHDSEAETRINLAKNSCPQCAATAPNEANCGGIWMIDMEEYDCLVKNDISVV